MENFSLFFGIAGLLIISASIWLRNERRQDVLFILGGLFLLLYSISIRDKIFIILQCVFIASSLIEIVKLRKRR